MEEQLREKVQELLQKPLKKMNSNNVQEIFKEIAKNLFNNFCINCGDDKHYYFAEIEFYYYKKDKWLHDEKIAYKRDDYSAGSFFYHLSGVDICFDSRNDEYGGILLRSIFEIDKNNNRKVITGPLNCLTSILNSCKNGIMPSLIGGVPAQFHPVIEPTYRYFGDEDRKKIVKGTGNKDGDIKMAFFDTSIKKEEWDAIKEDGSKKYYYTHRFVYK